MVLAALETTVDQHLRKATPEVPALQLLSLPDEQLRARGRDMLERFRSLPLAARLVESRAEIGGGALPRSVIRSLALELSSPHLAPNELARRLRSCSPPVIGYVTHGQFKLDLRTIFPEQDNLVFAALATCLTSTSE